MSTRVEASAVAAGVTFAVWLVVVGVAWIRRGRSAAGARAAVRLAAELGIELPEDGAERLERRLSRRVLVSQLVSGPPTVAWVGLYTWALDLFGPITAHRPSTVPPMVWVYPLWGVLGLAYAAGHVYDLVHTSREPGTRVARLVTPRLRDAVPRSLSIALRGVGLLPALAAAVWLLAPVRVQHGAHAAHPHPALFVLAALAGPASVVATEAAQRRILSGLQNARSPQELAFDDALRAQTVLAVMIAPMALCSVLATLVVAPLDRAFDWGGSVAVIGGIGLLILPLALLMNATRSKWARRHYLRTFAAYSAGPDVPPPGTPAPVAPWTSPC